MGAIDSSIVNVALPHIRGAVGATLLEITWISTGYAIALVLVMPLTAFLGRQFGQKRVYMVCLALFLIGSLLCGTATTLPVAGHLPRHPGARRRRAPADGAGDPPADVPAQGAGHGHGALRHGGHARAGHWPDARRLHRRSLSLVVDLLHQPADRRSWACSWWPPSCTRIRNCSSTTGSSRRSSGRTWTGSASC